MQIDPIMKVSAATNGRVEELETSDMLVAPEITRLNVIKKYKP